MLLTKTVPGPLALVFSLLLWCVVAGTTPRAAGQTHPSTAALPDAPDAALQAPAPLAQNEEAPVSAQNSTLTPGASGSQDQTKEQGQQTAAQQLKQEEKQRILGVVPNFATTDNQNAAPLTVREKFSLDLHSSLDPFEFVFAGLDAAEEQAENTFPEYGQGAAGYGKRFGASYADTFDGGLWGNAILPSLLHEDPRYFRKGSGPFLHRALYSAWTTVWCKRDSGTWGPNYANVGGNFIAGGISNLYYPQSDRGAELTITRALTVTAEGAIGSEFVEFWPDISHKLLHTPLPRPAAQQAPDATKPVEQTNGTTTPRTNPQ